MNKLILSGTITRPEKRFTSDNKAVWSFKLSTGSFEIPVSCKSEKLELTDGNLSVVVGSLYTKTNADSKKLTYVSANSVELFNTFPSEVKKEEAYMGDDLIDEDSIPFWAEMRG